MILNSAVLKIILNGLKEKPVKALGFWFSSDPNITVSHNYIDKVEKVKAMVSCWKNRRLRLLGKITIIKCLAVSQLVYILAPLQKQDHRSN